MKMRLPIRLLLSTLIFIFCTGELSAANTKPVDCVSITNFYPRAPEDVTYYSFGNPIELFYGYMPYFRGFIPPGTVMIDLLIIENGNQMAVAHHKTPPTGLPQFPPEKYTNQSSFTLSQLEGEDQWAAEQQGFLYIASDSFLPLDISRAGWLYVKVGGGGYSPNYSTQFSVRVNTKIYNEWWERYIKNDANWKTYVEDVETYVDPTNTTTLAIQVTPSNQAVAKEAGTTSFSVSSTGTGTMAWTAAVTSGSSSWLSITSGAGGSNSGTINCEFTANNGKAARTDTIRVTATGANNSPVDVTVTQAGVLSLVPDTGQTACYDAAGIEIKPCPSSGQPFFGQDANYNINPMSYTKLDGSGHDLPDFAISWVMVRDNVTGLIWEMKTDKDGKKDYSNPHDADNTYTWYDDNPDTNGGIPGTPGDSTDTEDFIKALNDEHYGGFSDWRLPTIKELAAIVNYDNLLPGPTINSEYFQNTQSGFYWTSTTYAQEPYLAWGVHFDSGYYNADYYFVGYGKTYSGYVRAVRGGQSGPSVNSESGSIYAKGIESMDAALTLSGSYINNNDGTVTDTFTGLMWQQDSSDNMTWEQALKYCEELELGNHADWRLPSIKELSSLVDYNRCKPAINTTFFPDKTASFYWASTSYAYSAEQAWGVDFDFGGTLFHYKSDGSHGYSVRAVRSVPFLSVSPPNRDVAKYAGTTTFSVSNTGTGTMSWTATVTSGGSWLKIESGATGKDKGTINCSFTANDTTGASARTGTIRVTADVATGSPAYVTVIQAPVTSTQEVCTATLDANLFLNIPYLDYVDQTSGTLSLWTDFIYDFNPAYPTLIPFKLKNANIIISNPSFSCTASTISSDLAIHIPDLMLSDGVTHLWVDMDYNAALSTDGNFYWVVTNYGFVSN